MYMSLFSIFSDNLDLLTGFMLFSGCRVVLKSLYPQISATKDLANKFNHYCKVCVCMGHISVM